MHFRTNNILKSNYYNTLICLLHAEQTLVLHAGVEFVVGGEEEEKNGLFVVEREASQSCCRLVVEVWVETPTTSAGVGYWKKVCGGEEEVRNGYS